MRIHLDTDLGGDTDDACALAMLLGWPEAEITGITTVADPGGRRAAYVAHLLHLAGRDDIPLAAGAEVSATTLGREDPNSCLRGRARRTQRRIRWKSLGATTLVCPTTC